MEKFSGGGGDTGFEDKFESKGCDGDDDDGIEGKRGARREILPIRDVMNDSGLVIGRGIGLRRWLGERRIANSKKEIAKMK